MSESTIGFNSRIIAALAYAFGFISGVAVLVVERDDKYVRFHAMQSTLTFLGVFVGSVVMGSVPALGQALTGALSLVVVGLWFLLMFKAFSGERYKLPYVGDVVERQIR